jgi:DUF438 domain-containing protein
MTSLALLERLDNTLQRYGQLKKPPTDDADVRNLLNQLGSVLIIEVTQHSFLENKYLFPRLMESADASITMILQAEHDIVRGIVKQIIGLVTNAGEFDDKSWAEFHSLGQELLERYAFHVQKEEMACCQN